MVRAMHPRAVCAIHGTVGGAALEILADSGAPRVATVAIGVAIIVVNPAPVGVYGDLSFHRGAAATGTALLPVHLGTSLGCLLSDLLGNGQAQDRMRTAIFAIILV